MVRNAFLNVPNLSPLYAVISTRDLSQSTRTRPLSDEDKPKDVLQPLTSIQPTGPGCNLHEVPKTARNTEVSAGYFTQ